MNDSSYKVDKNRSESHLSATQLSQPLPQSTMPHSGKTTSTESPIQAQHGPCPYLALKADNSIRYMFPNTEHRCYVSDKAVRVSVEHQHQFCLTGQYNYCNRFAEPLSINQDSIEITDPQYYPSDLSDLDNPNLPRILAWLGSLILVVCIGWLLVVYFDGLNPENYTKWGQALLSKFNLGSYISEETPTVVVTTSTPTATQTLSVADTRFVSSKSADSDLPPTLAIFKLTLTATPTATPTDGPDLTRNSHKIHSSEFQAGWVGSSDERGNHFQDSFMYAGVFQGQTYHGAFQFDLSELPRGAPIYAAAVQMTGLRDDRLGQGGFWSLRLLDGEVDLDWSKHNYQTIFNAKVAQTISPILSGDDLSAGQVYRFELNEEQIAEVRKRIVDLEEPKLSFRMDGPLAGPDNLFAWDTGFGSQSENNRIVLLLEMGEQPPTPPPYDFVVVTNTPTPENVTTAVALMLTRTAQATQIGTATPTPRNMVTATPIPEELVIIPTATPENEATASAMVVLATARALTTGTSTPFPANAITATPLPTPTPTPTMFIITATPTPESVLAAATAAVMQTWEAQTYGTPTNLPANWVTPIVVTTTPTPANAVTAEALQEIERAKVFVYGPATPIPFNMVTATPTPAFVLLDGQFPSGALQATVTPYSGPLPDELIGKIAFKSNRDGTEQIYVVNPDGSGLGLLSDPQPYFLAKKADVFSSDGRFWTFVRSAIRYEKNPNALSDTPFVRNDAPAVYWYDAHYAVEQQLTYFGAGDAYDSAWSPTAERIVFVSNDSQNDEIWVVNRDGSDLRQLTFNVWEWDKHPTWSPDGQQIAFWSNRSGYKQIWIMNADGTDQHPLSQTTFDDWDPVWIKYTYVPSYTNR